MEANYGEGSGPNKRPHVEKEAEVSQQASRRRLEKQPEIRPMPQNLSFQQSNPAPLFQAATNERSKKKGQKRVDKKTKPLPVMGVFNDLAEKYNFPVSIRHVLQNNKIDISWMNLVAWSPTVCREIKRLCTRVSKRTSKKSTQHDSNLKCEIDLSFFPRGIVALKPIHTRAGAR